MAGRRGARQASALSSKVSLLLIKYDLEHSGSGKGGMTVSEAIECAHAPSCGVTNLTQSSCWTSVWSVWRRSRAARQALRSDAPFMGQAVRRQTSGPEA